MRLCVACSLLLVLLSLDAAAADTKPCTPSVVGDLRVESIPSKTFGGTQTLRIWLPPGYSDAANTQRSYPVLYMLDGQNLFDSCTATFGHEWQIDETLTRLIQAGSVEPIIVVGLDNRGDRRPEEYLPYPDALYAPDLHPRGADYPAFLVSEVLPRVEKEFRTRSGRLNTAIGGSSYGAIAALNALITRPMVFGIGLMESPSLQVGNGEFVRQARSLSLGPQRAYVGVGTAELVSSADDDRKRGLPADAVNTLMVHSAEALAESLRSSEQGGAEVKFVAAPGAHHQEQAWAARFADAIQFLFPKQPAAPPEQ